MCLSLGLGLNNNPECVCQCFFLLFHFCLSFSQSLSLCHYLNHFSVELQHIFIFVYILSPIFSLALNFICFLTLTLTTDRQTPAGPENRRHQLLFAFRPHSVFIMESVMKHGWKIFLLTKNITALLLHTKKILF